MQELYQKFLDTDAVTTDSRENVVEKMYVAIKGDVFDGNKFIEQVLDAGAKYVITNRTDVPTDQRIIVVEDTLKTIQDLAAYHRNHFTIPIIAIGGSNGKTTTKELLAEVLGKKYSVLKTEGNLNNHLGVAKTLLRLKQEHEIAVIEIGANHLAEHDLLMNMVRPTHILVTNNGLDHLEGFGSPENVRMANKEIYDWAQGRDVTAFVDESQSDLMTDSEGLQRIFYTPKSEAYESSLAGDFNKINVLAAMKIGETFTVPEAGIEQAIKNYKPSLLRSESLEYRGAFWVADCYNANPSSMKLAIDSFVAHSKNTKRGLILGGMREMGEFSHSEHQKLVDYIVEQNAELVVLVGDEFENCNIPKDFHLFKTSSEAKAYLDSVPLDGFNLLLKGSRGIKLEVIIDRKL